MLDRKVDAAAFAVTISEFNKNVILEECGEQVRDKIRVVHCGVDPEVFTPRERRAASEGDDPRMRLLCVASYEEVKGHRYLIEACQLLRDRHVEFQLDLVGEGPCRAEVEQHIDEANLGDRVIMHGAQPRDVVRRMMSDADIMCLPSVPTAQGKREGIPVVLMEAMASGLPVLSSRLSGIPELVDDGISGMLVEPRDSAGIAAALEHLSKDADLRVRMGAGGREKIEAHFNLQQNAERLAGLFVGTNDERPGDLTRFAGDSTGGLTRPRRADAPSSGGDSACST